MEKENNLTLSSVIRGFSEGFHKQNIYFKHFGILDANHVDKIYADTYEKSVSLGVPTEKGKLKSLKEQGLWSDKKDEDLNVLNQKLDSLKTSKKKLLIQSQIIEQNRRIKACEKDILAIEREKEVKLGDTAEVFARKRSNEYFIYYSSFKDENLTQPICSVSEFDEFSNIELDELVKEYNKVFLDLTTEKIKESAISNIVISLVGLCGENLYGFYAKPVVNLTYLQVELLNFAKYYHSIIVSSSDIPKEVREDPDELEDWYNANLNAKEIIESKQNQEGDGTSASTIVGGSKKDLEYSGFEKGGKKINLASMLKKGGKMNMDQLAKL